MKGPEALVHERIIDKLRATSGATSSRFGGINKSDGHANTVEVGPVVRDPATGRLKGVKIGPCRACGRIRRLDVARGLCGVASCRKRRQKVYTDRIRRKRASDWLKSKQTTSA